MKQLEIQIQQLQEELNIAKNNIHIRSVNNSSGENLETTSSTLHSTHVSPQQSNNNNQNSQQTSSLLQNSSSNPSYSSSSNQIELLKTNEKFLKEKVRTN